jgi:hypothetical protein
MRKILRTLMLSGLIGAQAAVAQVPDPTRPAVVVNPAEVTAGAAAPVESGVQTVILRRGGKSAAVINGQYVEVGGMLGEMRVLKISESEVILRGENGREVIKVTPEVQKVPAKKQPSIRQRTTGTTQK